MSTQSKKLNVLIIGSGSHVAGFVVKGFRDLARQNPELDVDIFGYDIREDAQETHKYLNIENANPQEFLKEGLNKGGFNVIVVATRDHKEPVQQIMASLKELLQSLKDSAKDREGRSETEGRFLICVEKPTFPTLKDYEDVLKELRELDAESEGGVQVGLFPMHHARYTPTYEALQRALGTQTEKPTENGEDEDEKPLPKRIKRVLVCRADPYIKNGAVSPHAPNESPLVDSGPNIIMEMKELARRLGLNIDWRSIEAEGRYKGKQQTAFAFAAAATQKDRRTNLVRVEGYTDWELGGGMNTKFSVVEFHDGTRFISIHTIGNKEGPWASLTLLYQNPKGSIECVERLEGNRMQWEYNAMAREIGLLIELKEWEEELEGLNEVGMSIVQITERLSNEHEEREEGGDDEGLLSEVRQYVAKTIQTVKEYIEGLEGLEDSEGEENVEGTKIVEGGWKAR